MYVRIIMQRYVFGIAHTQTCSVGQPQHGCVSCTFLFNFLTQNGFRVESTRNYREKKGNDLIRGCRSVCQKNEKGLYPLMFFPA